MKIFRSCLLYIFPSFGFVNIKKYLQQHNETLTYSRCTPPLAQWQLEWTAAPVTLNMTRHIWKLVGWMNVWIDWWTMRLTCEYNVKHHFYMFSFNRSLSVCVDNLMDDCATVWFVSFFVVIVFLKHHQISQYFHIYDKLRYCVYQSLHSFCWDLFYWNSPNSSHKLT